jgi:HK97 family phage major capsid protein
MPPTATPVAVTRERLDNVRADIAGHREAKSKAIAARDKIRQKLAASGGDGAKLSQGEMEEAKDAVAAINAADEQIAVCNREQETLLALLGEDAPRAGLNGPADPSGVSAGEAGEWLAGQLQASVGTGDIGTIEQTSVIFHQLVTPASALLASGPTVVDIDSTTGQVLLVNGRLAPAPVVPEAGEIAAEDPPLDLADVKPPKYGKLVELTMEAYRDATPGRVALVEAAMVEAIGSGIDLACFHGAAGSAQPGLENTPGIAAIDVEGTLANLDPFVEAIARLRRGVRRARAFYMSPLTWERLGKLKKGKDSNEPLVSAQLSATGEPEESVLGVPVYQSDQIEEGVAFAARTPELVVIRRQDVETEIDPHYGFGTGEVGVRAITRLKLEVGDPTAVCMIENLPTA